MISIENIWKSFGDKSVLEDVSLEVLEGETLAVIGRSGSGKSVLMKHMIGLLTPDRGRVLVDGTDINRISYAELREVRQNFGVLFQGGALFDSMNAFDNVAFPLRTFTKLSEREVEKEVLTSLEMVELDEVGPKMPAELSGGMKKRVALARAVFGDARIVILDEPNSNLDADGEQALQRALAALKAAGSTLVIVAQKPSILAVVDKIIVLRNGQIEEIGARDEILAKVTRPTVVGRSAENNGPSGREVVS